MAAGGVGVLRRKGIHTYPGRDLDHPTNDLRGVKICVNRNHGVEHEFGGMSNGERSLVKGVETSTEEVLFEVPQEKKRKFSSITWDKNKDGKNSPKNMGKNVFPAFYSFPNGEEVDVDSRDDLLTSPVSEADNQVEPLTSETLMDDGSNDEQRKTLVKEEEEVVQVRNISLSRWASDSDSPRDIPDDDCVHGTCSTPGSRGLRSEGSVGNSSPTSGSNEQGCSIVFGSSGNESSDGSTVIDENQCENVSIDQVESDYEADDGLYPSDKPSVPSQRSINMLHDCRSIFEYEKLNKINEGTYGVVYKAKDMKSGEILALKKVKMDVHRYDDGFPLSSLREINILLSLSHPSIVNVKEVVMGDLDSIFMAMEYMEYDLKGLMELMNRPFSISEVKWLMLQLLEGVKYLHDNWVLHRDLKASNLLLNKDGELKICDFGMSRQYGSPLKPFTSLVVTLWYRAPEILLGKKQYSTAVDMWSVGCIMAEMLARKPLFNGKTEVDQLDKIFRTMGTPNDAIWPGVSKLPGMKANFVKQPYNALRKKFPPTSFTAAPVLSDLGFDLLSQLLTYDPEKRITAAAALDHDWFHEAPLPRSDFKPSYSALHDQSRYISGRQHGKHLKR